MIRTGFLLLAFVAIFSSSQSRHSPNDDKYTPTPPPKILQAYQCEVNTSTDNLKGYLPRGKRICAQITESQLLKRLQEIGGYNPRYTAMNKTQAKTFQDPRWFLTEEPSTTQLPPTSRPLCRTATYPVYLPTKPWHKKPWHKKPWHKKPWNKKPWNKKPWHKKPWHKKPWHKKPRRGKGRLGRKPAGRPWKLARRSSRSQEDRILNEMAMIRRKEKLISKRAESVTKECWNTAQAVQSTNNQRYHLCGECHVVTNLDDNVRPRLINEATCKHGLANNDSQKDDSKVCAFNSGLCKQRILRFPALRDDGKFEIDVELSKIVGQTIYVAKWNEFTQDIKAGCQCQMFRSHIDLLQRFG